MKPTMSLCPICYKEIPAVIYYTDVVMMNKTCPIHGNFIAMVEKDIAWYELCQISKAPSFYNGYFVDITSRCNLNCKYCYHDNTGEDRAIEDIIKDIEEHKDLAPFILTGGEPSLHKDIVEIVKQASEFGEVNMLTNGSGLYNEQLLHDLIDAGLNHESGYLNICLSFHPESKGADYALLNLCRNEGLKIFSVMYVIDEIDQIEDAIELFQKYSDIVENFRIKAISNLWVNSSVARNKEIYVSDMIKKLSRLGEVYPLTTNQKVSCALVSFNGLTIRLVLWYSAENVDLWDIDCPPYYKAQDGQVYDFVKACLINEKIKKQNGLTVRRAYINDIKKCSELWLDSVKETRKDAPNPSTDLWSSQVISTFQNDCFHFYVAEYKGEIVGYVTGYWMVNPLTSQIEIRGTGFYVKPEYRKLGAAKALHNKYLSVGKELGVTYSERDVTLEHAEILKAKGQEVVRVIIKEDIV